MKSNPAAGCFVLIGLFLLAFIGYLNHRTASNMLHQWRAERWPKVSATIDSSKLFVDDSGDGASYIPQISYHYRVAGRLYQSDRVRWGFNFTSRRWANHIVKKYSPGQSAELSVNPADPEDCVLVTGIDPRDWQAVLFLGPFNCLTLGLLLSPWLISRRYPESRRGGRLFLHLQYQNPLGRALLAGFLSCFGLIFVSALLYRMEVPQLFNQLEFSLIGLAVFWAGWKAWRSNQDLGKALEVERGRALTSPMTGRLCLSEIAYFEVEVEVTRDSDGDAVNHYWIALRRSEGQTERVHKADNEESARWAVEWLNRATDKAGHGG